MVEDSANGIIAAGTDARLDFHAVDPDPLLGAQARRQLQRRRALFATTRSAYTLKGGNR